MTAPLLSEELTLQLRGLQRLAQTRRGLWDTGDTRGAPRGQGREFLEHRRYTPGDDPRKLDWFASARSGHPMIRVTHQDEDAKVRVLFDTSASLGCGSPSKLHSAQTLIAALGYLALLVGHTVQLVVPDPEVPGALQPGPELRSTRSASRLVQTLGAARAAGATHWSSWLTRLREQARSPARCMVVSDFLAQELDLSELTRLAARGHELLLVQLYSRHEYLVQDEDGSLLQGPVDWFDSETGEHFEVNLDAQAVATYQHTFRSRVDTLANWCRTHSARFLLVASDELTFDTVHRLLLPDTGYTFPETSHA